MLVCVWQTSVAAGSGQKPQKQQANNDKLIVLTYHDIVADADTDPYSTSRSAFVAHMDYLQTHGYNPVSLSLVEKVYQKQANLPPKAVLLTFDDGLKSYADFVLPLLKTYHYPSVLSVVTGWLDGKDLPPEYAGKLLSWDALRTLRKSPLVNIISHTNDLHHFVRSNPQGNNAPAATTRIYSEQTGHYENEEQFRQRIAADLRLSVQRFRDELHFSPIGITWPYGKYDSVTMEEANALGMNLQLTLDEGPATLKTLPRLNRIMLGDYGIDDFVAELDFQRVSDERDYFAEIRLDPFAGLDPEAQNKLLSSLLDNLERLKVTAVILDPFDHELKKSFFVNDKVGIAADMLNRVAYQINSRLNVRHVYLAIPDGSRDLLLPHVVKDLSRLVWFNGIVFGKQTDAQVQSVKKITSYYHPGLRFGRYVTVDDGKVEGRGQYDFTVVRVTASQIDSVTRQQLLATRKFPGKVLVSIALAQNERHDFNKLFGMLNNLGIRNFGFSYNKNLYGLRDSSGVAHKRATDAVAVFGG